MMIYLVAVLSFVDKGLMIGGGWNDGQEADIYATGFSQYAKYVLRGNFT
jgi:hypothetical protein